MVKKKHNISRYNYILTTTVLASVCVASSAYAETLLNQRNNYKNRSVLEKKEEPAPKEETLEVVTFQEPLFGRDDDGEPIPRYGSNGVPLPAMRHHVLEKNDDILQEYTEKNNERPPIIIKKYSANEGENEQKEKRTLFSFLKKLGIKKNTETKETEEVASVSEEDEWVTDKDKEISKVAGNDNVGNENVLNVEKIEQLPDGNKPIPQVVFRNNENATKQPSKQIGQAKTQPATTAKVKKNKQISPTSIFSNNARFEVVDENKLNATADVPEQNVANASKKEVVILPNEVDRSAAILAPTPTLRPEISKVADVVVKKPTAVPEEIVDETKVQQNQAEEAVPTVIVSGSEDNIQVVEKNLDVIEVNTVEQKPKTIEEIPEPLTLTEIQKREQKINNVQVEEDKKADIMLSESKLDEQLETTVAKTHVTSINDDSKLSVLNHSESGNKKNEELLEKVRRLIVPSDSDSKERSEAANDDTGKTEGKEEAQPANAEDTTFNVTEMSTINNEDTNPLALINPMVDRPISMPEEPVIEAVEETPSQEVSNIKEENITPEGKKLAISEEVSDADTLIPTPAITIDNKDSKTVDIEEAQKNDVKNLENSNLAETVEKENITSEQPQNEDNFAETKTTSSNEEDINTNAEEVTAEENTMEIAALETTTNNSPIVDSHFKKQSENAALLSINFTSDTIAIPKEQRNKIHQLVGEFKNKENSRLKIISYAYGNEQTNSARRISLQRAIAIRAEMIQAGIDSIRINVQAMGDKPTKEGTKANRADIFVVGDSTS